MVGFKANQIRKVSGRSLPAQLRWLILTDNQIEGLPAEIGNCAQLQKLMLAGNRLRALPVEMAACSRLELLRLAANRLTELPAWLLSLPRLSWLAYAGNPLGETLEAAALADTAVMEIRWDALEIHHQLGEGASGVIHRAEQQIGDDEIRPVAVKLFKGAVTSDGLPDCEMAACMSAGDHPNLIPVLGKVKGHPLDTHGLVMDLIDPQFMNLAGPPSLESCTRDVYPSEARFDLRSALRIAHGIASAACHLHRQGIMHGDLYAHNILTCGQGRALLGDFGAASFVPDNKARAVELQRIEVRAFGCLLEELIERCDAREDGLKAALVELKTRCLTEAIGDRPLFDDIERALSVLVDSDEAASAGG
jgi:hypothetical protein